MRETTKGSLEQENIKDILEGMSERNNLQKEKIK